MDGKKVVMSRKKVVKNGKKVVLRRKKVVTDGKKVVMNREKVVMIPTGQRDIVTSAEIGHFRIM